MTLVSIKNGKGEWVRKRRDYGSYENICLCVNNIDFSQGCISSTHAETGERSSINIACKYCYANYKNYHPADPYEFDAKKIEEELSSRFKDNPDFKYLRFGKNVDVGPKLYRQQLISALEILGKLGGQGIIIQKHLDFDETVAKLARETCSVIFFSIGYDPLEPGACSYGHNNDFRFKMARKYREAGVNTGFKLLTDLTVEPEKADRFCRGNAWKALEWSEKYDLYLSLLPFRIKSSVIAQLVTGVPWDVLKDTSYRGGLIKEYSARAGSYVIEEKIPSNIEDYDEGEKTNVSEKRLVTYLIPKMLHPFWKQYETHICGKVGSIWEGYEYCDKCHMIDLEGRLLKPIKFRQRLLPHVDTSQLRQDINESNKRKREKKKKKKEEESGIEQITLFEDEL